MGRAGGAGSEAAQMPGAVLPREEGLLSHSILRSCMGVVSCTSLGIIHIISFKLFKYVPGGLFLLVIIIIIFVVYCWSQWIMVRNQGLLFFNLGTVVKVSFC